MCVGEREGKVGEGLVQVVLGERRLLPETCRGPPFTTEKSFLGLGSRTSMEQELVGAI